MGFNLYLYEKARELHSQDLLREAEKERRLSQLHRNRRCKHVAGKLGALRLQLGARLKQFEQSQTALKEHL